MKLKPSIQQSKSLQCKGFSLQEVVTSLAVVGVTLGGIMMGHVTSAKIGDFSATSAAAQQAAGERLEQTRAARWDKLAYPVLDELVSSNFASVTSNLDVPGAKGVPVSATVTTSIADVSVDPPLRRVTVECVWSLSGRGPFTNSIATLRCPDQ